MLQHNGDQYIQIVYFFIHIIYLWLICISTNIYRRLDNARLNRKSSEFKWKLPNFSSMHLPACLSPERHIVEGAIKDKQKIVFELFD